jgi:carbonic anhydrase/acetyltransferase-like protein (isoleucine patch superfamily)
MNDSTDRFPGAILLPYGDHEPTIAEDGWVAPGAAVIGDVTIGSESSVWFNTTIRGDVMPIRIGARTSIQDNSVIHATDGWAPTIVGEDCVVGHNVILHGCTLGDRVLVGMGTIILDAARIGDDVLIGAGSLVTARTEVPSGVLMMGRPAKVKRELTDEERESILSGAIHYVQKTHAYRGD